MIFFRKIWRLLQLFPWLAFMAVYSWKSSHNRDEWTAVLEMSGHTKMWGRGLLKIFHIELHVSGDPEKYNGELIVSNHMGYVDIFVHAAIFGLRFTPKSDIRKWPVLGWYVGLIHPIWIDRKSRLQSKNALTEFRETLEHKVPLIIYPEGTSSDGAALYPFKTSAFELAAQENISVLPIITTYHVPGGNDSDPCWFGDDTIMGHLWKLVGLKKIIAKVQILDPVRADGLDRKELAQKLHGIMEEAHRKCYSERNLLS